MDGKLRTRDEVACPRAYILLLPVPLYQNRGVSSKFRTPNSSSRHSGWGHPLYLTFMDL